MVVRIIHMIGSLDIGGSQTMIMNIYRKIDRNRIQFDFIVDHSDQLYFKEEIEKLGGRVFVMPRFNGKNIFQVQKAWNCFFDAHPEYHVLHSHVRSYASIYFPIAKKHDIKTIVHSHSTSNGSGIKSVSRRTRELQWSVPALLLPVIIRCRPRSLWINSRTLISVSLPASG